MMPHDYSSVVNPRTLNSPQHVFEKSPPFELQQGLGLAHHAFGLTGCQYDCGNQWDNAYMKVFTAIR